MNAFVPHIRVVAALIERRGRYLITQRSTTAVLAGLWEFPSAGLRQVTPTRLPYDAKYSPV